MVMKFHNFDIFYKFCYIFVLSSALACRAESIDSEPAASNRLYELVSCTISRLFVCEIITQGLFGISPSGINMLHVLIRNNNYIYMLWTTSFDFLTFDLTERLIPGVNRILLSIFKYWWYVNCQLQNYLRNWYFALE